VDLIRLRAFVHEKNPAAAERVAAALVEAIGTLETLPERGHQPGPRGIRDLVVRFGRSSYIILYRYSRAKQTTVIGRILHGREARDRPKK
jgi:plasmid stabilization system protein ParE